MKHLVICEKPSLAQNVCKALSLTGEHFKFNKNDGYSTSENYVVIPAFGHLFSLYDIEMYDDDYDESTKQNWKLENLPFYPEEFKFSLKKDFKTKKIDKGVEKQFDSIQKWIKSDEISNIINCGDSDREGEIIVRTILSEANNVKPVYRLWLPDQTEDTIIKSLNEMNSSSDYDDLANEGYARMYIDWLTGINLTRYSSLKTNSLMRVGRVKTAIIKAIYDRELNIKNFIPVKYFSVINTNELELKSKKKFSLEDKNKAEEYVSLLNNNIAIVSKLETKEKTISSPKLFSQSSLQNLLSKNYKYSPDKTLEYVQSLYEKGFVSYPRTPTEYLSENEKEKVKSIITSLNSNYDLEFKDKKTIFDNSKIESHSAITPTTKVPKKEDFKSVEEENTYNTILNRFKAVFCKENCVVAETVLEISVGDVEIFILKGQTSISKGWKLYEVTKDEKNNLPNLKLNDQIDIQFKLVEKETEPPKHYSVETLNNYLKNPFKKEKALDDDTEEYKAILNGTEIGTEATRAGIIKECILAGYLELKGSNYLITNNGIFYIESLEKLEIDLSVKTSVELNQSLKKVYKGDYTVNQSIDLAKEFLNKAINMNIEVEKKEVEKLVVGTCPICGKNVIEHKNNYQCESNKFTNVNGKYEKTSGCGFVIFRTISGKQITGSMVKKLLKKGKTDLLKGFKSKAGKPFEAYLILKADNNIGFEFIK